MILKHTLLLILSVMTSGCHKTQTVNGLLKKNITIDGRVRRYALYIPKIQNDKKMPLVFVLHGGGGNIENMTGESRHKSPYKLWMSIADTAGLFVIFPQAVNGTTGKPNWNDCRENCLLNPAVDDVKFISQIINETEAHYNVDPARIYTTGISNGGLMSLRLAVELPDRIAAAAPVSASMPDTSECIRPARAVPVLFMNGTADPLLPYNGGIIGKPPKITHGTVFPVPVSVSMWININRTDTVPVEYDFPDLDPDDGGTVQTFTYSNGINGSQVVLYRVNGGGHTAPSIQEQYSALLESYLGKQNHDIEMAVEIWKFFRDKRLSNQAP